MKETRAEMSIWTGLHEAALSFVLAQTLEQRPGVFLVITADMSEANRLYDELQFFSGGKKDIFIFPDWETLPYDTFSPHEDILSMRMLTLSRLPYIQSGVVIIPVTTLMHPVMPRDYLQANSLILSIGQKFDVHKMRADLQSAGYRAVDQVMQHGEFALRGSILDLFPMGSDKPYRIDLLDNEIDSIRWFDPQTQRSLEKLNEVQLLPAKEHLMTETGIMKFRQQWREKFAGRSVDCPIYEAISSGVSPAGIEYYLPLFYDKYSTIFDYLSPETTVVQLPGINTAAEQFWTEVRARYEQYGSDVTRPLLAPNDLFLSVDKLFGACKSYSRIFVSNEAEEKNAVKFNTFDMPHVTIDHKSDAPLAQLFFAIEHRPKVLLLAETAGRREALMQLLSANGIHPKIINSWSEFQCEGTFLCVAPLDNGLNSLDPDTLVIPEALLYDQKIMQRRRRKTQEVNYEFLIRNLAELEIGMPVVHIEQGIGRYEGLKRLQTGDIDAEFVVLQYADEAKLYVPVADLHVLSRYTGGDSDHAPLHRLGSEQWGKAKQKAAEKARDVAAELLEIYAKRAAKPGQANTLPEKEYEQFAESFPFEETPDQVRVIHEVIEDMVKDKPMDRLVCGDVGFGKTEVALRAAFIAVQNHKQVAVLVPTTLLAEQHYQNFKDRFADWPFKIALLSRFRSDKEQDVTLEALANGKVDIVIGTHKLLQENVKFLNLGLLVIDEEHRFGVRQKEKIKALRTDVDILTLTATPIPRTLNMAMSHIRDLSLITTPPARRLSIKTFVLQRENRVIREALLREILRGGQVYFLHNNVSTIEKTAHDLAELVPEAKVGIAHGQMRERDLERVMADFYHQRFNVLVCTTIIETGIDIPTANTIIMDRADHLGLAQMHQLRGRVGRSHHQAYAYLLTPPPKLMTPEARKRLDAIVEAEDLGAGFLLATHDLEIRGAGEFLGDEQSGQIASVGFSLYMEFLDSAVNALKSGKMPDFSTPIAQTTEIDLHLSALIPDDYLSNVHQRLMLYKRIANAKDKEALKELYVEMIDRFGLLPDTTKNLFRLAELKLKTFPLGILKIQVGSEGGYIEFNDKPNIEPIKLIQLIQKEPHVYKLQGPKKLSFSRVFHNAEQRFKFVEHLISVLS